MASKTQRHVKVYVEPGANKGCWMCWNSKNAKGMRLKSMLFSVSVLFHSLVTSNFKYGKLLHACN